MVCMFLPAVSISLPKGEAKSAGPFECEWLLCTCSPPLVILKNCFTVSSVSLNVGDTDDFFMKQTLTIKETSMDKTTPSNTGMISSLGANPATRNTLHGDEIETRPTWNNWNVNVPTIPPKIKGRIRRRFFRTYEIGRTHV